MTTLDINRLVSKSRIVPKHIRDEYRSKIHRKQQVVSKLQMKVNNSNRRVSGRKLTLQILQKVYEDNIKKYGCLTCIICNKPITFGDDSLEHIIPVTKKGNNNYDNLGITHLSCNHKKNTLTLNEWNIQEEVRKLFERNYLKQEAL